MQDLHTLGRGGVICEDDEYFERVELLEHVVRASLEKSCLVSGCWTSWSRQREEFIHVGEVIGVDEEAEIADSLNVLYPEHHHVTEL